ncbi:MAG: WD40/YVTN/BNR-like repeat-containing protein [Planctomycetota bacterium]|jgi:photosystem II stability/assembly factor-like uncharacterized protein
MVIGTAPVGATSWFPLDSGTDQNLEAVQFPVDDQTGYAAGGQGTILKTTDGGETWVAQTSGSAAGLRGMCFVNASIGFVVGSGGEILRTDDGGATWVPQTSNTTEVLRDVVFPVDDQTGYISGDNGTILKTVDGGANWSAQSSGTTMDLLGLDFPVDNQTGYAAGWAGEMVKTTDGGANWSGLNSGTTTHLYDIKFPVDTQTGYACGNAAEMYRTTDGGATWTLEITGGPVCHVLSIRRRQRVRRRLHRGHRATHERKLVVAAFRNHGSALRRRLPGRGIGRLHRRMVRQDPQDHRRRRRDDDASSNRRRVGQRFHDLVQLPLWDLGLRQRPDG